MSEDLAARLLAEIADAEFEANGSHEPWCAREGRDRADGEIGVDECSCGRPDEIRRRCAADRKIVADCVHTLAAIEKTLSKPHPERDEFGGVYLARELATRTLSLVAEGYGITVDKLDET